jgi:hypothetical protein
MIETGGSTLEEGGDKHDAAFLGYLTINIGRGAWNGFCEVEEIDIFYLTEIEGVMELLKDYEFCTALSKVANAVA